jgi:hypothetical protein
MRLKNVKDIEQIVMVEWKFHTHVTPDHTDDLQTLSFNEAFRVFFATITHHYPRPSIETPRTRMTIPCTGADNIIPHQYDTFYFYYKDRFLKNKMFKSRLFHYFQSQNIFMKNPVYGL